MKLLAFIGRIAPLVLVAVFLSGCNEKYDWHQKVTVEIETPDGVVTGSSVMAGQFVDTRGSLVPAEASGVSFFLHGEAVVLEVAPGRYLFALLKGMPSLSWLFYPGMDAAKSGPLLEAGDTAGVTEAELTRDQYPLLVTFDDINDPASVKRVDPNNLAATFGPGYRLNAITMTITGEPMTEGRVEEVLGWLGQYPETPILPSIKPTDFSFEAKLRQGDFLRR